jgi:isomerase DpgB
VVTPLADVDLAVAGTVVPVDQVNAVCARAEATGAPVLLRLGGADVGAAPYDDATVQTVNRWERALRRLERLPAMTVAAADGRCTGPALDVLLTVDYRVGSAATRLAVPSVGAGPWPGMALYRLANQVGTGRARRLALFGSELPAAQAADWGLLDEVVDDPLSRAAQVIAGAGGNGRELSIRRRLLLEAVSTSFEDALGAHLAACDRALRRAAVDASHQVGQPGGAVDV